MRGHGDVVGPGPGERVGDGVAGGRGAVAEVPGEPVDHAIGIARRGAVEMHLGAIVQGRLVHQGSPAKAVELKLAASN